MAWQPYGAAGDPFTLPKQTSNYWDQGAFAATPVGQIALNQAANRSAAFTRFNQLAGIDPFANQGKNYNKLYPQVSLGYDAAVLEDPELTFEQYYNLIRPQLQNAIAGWTPADQGKNVRQYVGLARTIPRAYG